MNESIPGLLKRLKIRAQNTQGEYQRVSDWKEANPELSSLAIVSKKLRTT